MTKRFCDCCGDELTLKTKIGNITLKIKDGTEYTITPDLSHEPPIDICKRCFIRALEDEN